MANNTKPLKVTTLDDVLKAVQSGNKPKYNFMLGNDPINIGDNKGLTSVRFTTPKSAIFDRLSDGTYIPKFENFKGNTDNEDRLAKEQGFVEQAIHGIGKNVTKAFVYALDSTVGTAWGIVNGIKEGSWDAVWNNDLSNALDDFNTKLDNNLVNYYTQEERDRGLLSAIPGFGATNFWFNDVAGGLAFVGGVVIPEIAIGVLSGGTTTGVSAGKIGFKLGSKGIREGAEATAKTALKEGAESATKAAVTYNAYKKGTEVLRQYQRAIYSKVGGDVLGTGLFLVRSSNFEAGMEARHNYHDAVDRFYNDFVDRNGRPPSYEETTQFMKDAKTAANGVYAANMAILSVSNAVMFSNKFRIGTEAGKALKNKGNHLIGLGVTHTPGGKSVIKEATRGQKLLGNSYFILGKPAVEGLYEEGFQGVAGTTMQKWLDAKYSPENESAYDVWSSLTDAFAHQYGSAEGWKEMGIGMIIGSMGGVMQGGGVAGIGKNSRKQRFEQVQSDVAAMNASQDNLLRRLNSTTGVSAFGKLVDSKSKSNKTTYTESALINKEYIKTQERVKSKSEILEDYDAVVDNMQLSDAQIENIGIDNVDAYKASLKQGFRESMDSYTFAKKAASAIGFGEDITKGNDFEVRDALINNIMIGKGSLAGAKAVASQISDLTGINGAFDFLQHFNNLSVENKAKVKELKAKKRQLDNFRKQAIKYQSNLAGIQTGRKLKDETNYNRYLKASDNLAMVKEAISKLELEIESITNFEGTGSLDLASKATSFDLDGLTNFDSNQSMLDVIESLDKLDDFTNSLALSGRTQDAKILKNLLSEFKSYSDAHREMVTNYHRMLDTNFFSSKSGKGLLNSIIGDKYQMSEEFRAILKENDKAIDESLKYVGITRDKNIDQFMEDVLEKNPELSEREKHRLEAIIRLQLGYATVREKISTLADEAEIPGVVEDISNEPLNGDTVKLMTVIDPNSKELSNVAVLNDLIGRILSELDRFKLTKVNSKKISELESKLEELKSQREKILSEGNTELINGLKEDLKAEKAIDKEFRNEDAIKELENQISELENKKDTKEIDDQISQVENELEDTRKSSSVRLIKSAEYIRLNELLKKKGDNELTDEELEELNELEEDIDAWITISGIVSEGVRLSDLIEQSVALENTEVLPVESVTTPTNNEVIEQVQIQDKTGRVHYNLGQTYDAVTAVREKDGTIEISGITWESFIEEAGISKNDIEFTNEGKPKGGILKLNKQGNIVLDQEVVDEINKQGSLSILPTNQNLTTNYSVVLKHSTNENGEIETSVLKSNFSSGFKVMGISKGKKKPIASQMDVNAIYDIKPGDEVTLEVSPVDEYNEELLNAYKKARKDSTKEKALENLKRGLVIRVVTKDGKFVAVLKSKRDDGKKSENLARIFEGLRDSIVEDSEILESLLNIRSNRKLSLDGTITVNKIYPGHPSFNFKKSGDGIVSIESKPLTDNDIKHVVDLGYVYKGQIITRSKKKEKPDMTFLNKSMEANPDSKIPFVVVRKGNTEIAIPVTINPEQKLGLEEFERIYNSEIPLSDKAVQLNKFMASRGIDIKQPGNAFMAIGTNNNVNNEFYSKKLAELESIDYFRDLESWVNPSRDLNLLLRDGVLTSIDLSNPVHSPKVSLDFEDLNVEIKDVKKPDSVPAISKTTNDVLGSFKNKLDEARKKNC